MSAYQTGCYVPRNCLKISTVPDLAILPQVRNTVSCSLLRTSSGKTRIVSRPLTRCPGFLAALLIAVRHLHLAFKTMETDETSA